MDPQTQGGPSGGQQTFGRGGSPPGAWSEPGRAAEGPPTDRPDSGVADAARTAKQTGEDLGRQVRKAGEGLKESVGSMVDRGKAQVAEQVDAAARALHNAAGDLEEASPQAARLAHNMAHGVERATDYLRQDPRRILRDVEQFARREPLLFLGGALIAGVLIGRFIKASNARGYEPADAGDEGPSRPAREPRQQSVFPSDGPAPLPEPPGNPPLMGAMGGGI